ncbi:hypothetical protein QAD02_014973 [Eretmocerus hayati]|uniref:Uncharacterized protein n=1 Tax=Eretmocerus hayati TaxID=131215 RepID=A0ACC2P887_9HYME|nr:hypothetical protein QAD02_014973 [Eretmocerus hayati]
MGWREQSLGIKEKLPRTLNSITDTFLHCQNLQELSLCRCVMEVDDEYLSKLFRNNQNLSSLTLCRYESIGKCFTYLPLDKIEQIHLHYCTVDVQFIKPIMKNALKLHTLAIQVGLGCSSQFNQLEFSPVVPLKILELNLEDQIGPNLTSAICRLENLTSLSLRGTALNDAQLNKIVLGCAKLVRLNLGRNDDLTDMIFQSINSLSKLKVLSLTAMNNLTDAEIQKLFNNLRKLDVSLTNFSASAILSVIKNLQCLELLMVCCCKQLKTCFVKSAIDIVKQRDNKIPLKIEAFGTYIDVGQVEDMSSLVKAISR